MINGVEIKSFVECNCPQMQFSQCVDAHELRKKQCHIWNKDSGESDVLMISLMGLEIFFIVVVLQFGAKIVNLQ